MKMRKNLVAAQLAMTFICVQGGAAFAVGAWGDGPGCGLGQLVFASQPKAITHQVLGATTNGTFGSQTFGISTGTSGCTSNGQIVKNEQANVFASLNFENLSQEMAQGQGEHLASLATLLGIPAEQQPAFFSLTQEKYAALIAAGEQAPVALLTALQAAMATNPTLAKLVAQR
jgi:hypothetical protein